MSAPTLLVTGATGVIGRAAPAAARRLGFDVHGVSRRQADLLEPGAAAALVTAVAPTHLLHLAWDVGRGYLENADNERWRAASLALLESFARGGGGRATIAGTCLEYDAAAASRDLPETAPLAPLSPYARAKAALLHDAESLARRQGVSLAWGRVFSLFGPGEASHRLVPSVVRGALAGERVACTKGEQVRDVLPASEVARGLVALLHSEVRGPVNVAAGRGIELRELIREAAIAAGRPEVVELGALPTPEHEPSRLVADTTRLRCEVGFKPSTDRAAAMRETVQWWRSRG